MSACASIPTMDPARPASGSDVAPPPTPMSITVPPFGQRLERAAGGGRRRGIGRRLTPPAEALGREPPRRLGRVREDGLGDGPGRQLLAPPIRRGHASAPPSRSRRTSASCSPSSGGGVRVPGATPSNRIGLGHRSQRAAHGVVDLLDQLRAVVRREHLVHRHDRRARHAGLLQQGEPLAASDVARTTSSSSGISSSRCTTRPSFVTNRAIVGPVRVLHDLARPGEQPVVARGEDERPVARVEGLVRHDVRVRGAHPLRDHAADQVVRRLIDHGGDARVEQRDAHVASAAGDVALAERGQHAHRCVEARDDVEQRDARLRRLAVALARDAHQAGERLHDDVVAGSRGGLGCGRSERRQRARDQPRLRLAEVVEPQPEPLHQSRPEVLDHDVGRGDEPSDEGHAFGRAQIGRHRALVAVQREEVGGVVPGERRSPVPRVVALARALDLDHVRAQVGEDHGAQRAGQDAGEVDDPHAGERGGGSGRILGVRHRTRERLHRRRGDPTKAEPPKPEGSSGSGAFVQRAAVLGQPETAILVTFSRARTPSHDSG